MFVDSSGKVGIGTTTPSQALELGASKWLSFEGATDDAYETILQVVDPTGSDKTITFPNETGTVCTTGSVCTGYQGTITNPVTGTGTNLYNAYWTGTSTLGSEQYVALTRGGTGTTLTANNGGIVYSNATNLAILAGTATANQILMSGSSTTPAWSTATYPATTTINQILYSSAANTIGGITTANSSFLTTNSSGVPSFTLITADTFVQYALLAGRSGGQILQGGSAQTETLTLKGNSATASGTDIAGGNILINATPGTGTGASSIIFQTGRTLTTGSTLQTLTEAMRILGSGYVGIGTTAPNNLLSLYQASADAGISFGDTSLTRFTFGTDYSDSSKLKISSGSLLGTNDLITITDAQTSFQTPAVFEAAGDVAMANDLLMTNAASGNIKFQGPGYLATDSSWQNLDLTLSAANTGYVIVDDTLQQNLNSTATAAGTEYGIYQPLNDTGIVTTGTDTTYGLYQALTRTGATGGTINSYGIYSNVVADNAGSGTSTAVGGYFSATGADNNYAAIFANGSVGIGVTAPTAKLQLGIGTTAASSAPLKFTSGSLLATPEAGAVEFLTDAYYGTITTGAARKTFAFLESPTFTGTVTIPTPFTLGATSVTTTGARLNYLTSAGGTTGTASTNLVFSTSPVLTNPVIANITPGANFTLTQNSVVPFTSVESGAVANTLYLNAGKVGIGTTAPVSLLSVYSSTDHPVLTITGANDSAYDPQIQFRTDATPTVKFSMGVDAGDSDKFKIYSGSGIGDTSEFTIDTNGVTSIANLQMGELNFPDDAGAVSWVDMAVSATPADNTVEAYSAQIDGNPVLTIYGLADHAGGVDNLRVGIGTTAPDTTLKVVGSICAKSTDAACFGTTSGNIYAANFIVDGTSHLPDYVFEPNYSLLPIAELKDYISLNQHLPGVPSAGEISQNGLNLGQMVPIILEKTEENTLYIIQNSDQLAQINLSVGGNAASLEALSGLVNSQLTIISNSLNALQTKDAELETKVADINNQLSLLTTLQSQVDDIKAQNETILSFLSVTEGKIDLMGGTLEAEGVVAGAFTVKVKPGGDSRTIGKYIICPPLIEVDAQGKCTIAQVDADKDGLDDATLHPLRDGKSEVIKTKVIKDNSKVFVTPKSAVDQPLAVTTIIPGDSFTVEVKNPLTQSIEFDWFVVGEQVTNE
jgi:hypothetical protein